MIFLCSFWPRSRDIAFQFAKPRQSCATICPGEFFRFRFYACAVVVIGEMAYIIDFLVVVACMPFELQPAAAWHGGELFIPYGEGLPVLTHVLDHALTLRDDLLRPSVAVLDLVKRAQSFRDL